MNAASRDLDDLKARVDLAEYLRSRGVPLRKRGRSWMARCPLHEDHTPSLAVDSQKGLWRCHGCGRGGDLLSWLREVDALSFPQAVERLRELADAWPAPLAVAPAPVPGNPELLERVAELYHQAFLASSRAQGYLASRGLTDPAMLRSFQVGTTDGKRLAGLGSAAELQRLGVLNERGKEVLTGCVTVPLRNPDGQVVGLYGRRLTPSENPHRYLAGSRQGLFYPEAARGTSRVYLVEGILDALALYQAGIPNVLALGGAQARPAALRPLLQKEGVREAVLVLDADEAGRAAALGLVPWLAEAGVQAWAVQLPEGQDPLSWAPQKPQARLWLLSQGSPPPSPPPGPEEPAEASQLGGVSYRLDLVGKPGNGKLLAAVRASREEKHFRDQVNLNSFKSRELWAQRAARALGVESSPLQDHLEILADRLERAPAAVPTQEAFPEVSLPELTPEERQEALDFLRQSDLVEALLRDIDALGYVGEREGKLLGYLIGISRKLAGPMAGIVSSGSGAGKSYLVEMVVELTTPGEVVFYSRLSPQALYFMPRTYLKAKLLVLEERAGGEAADYSVRTLQSKKRLTQAVVIKDPSTGRLVTRHYEVEGPVAYLETTTNLALNPENTSRCFEIPLDETLEQTRRVHQNQRGRRELDSYFERHDVDRIKARHHNAQRLLEPIAVVIPYVRHLTFPDRWLRTRRDHERFLTLIEALAFLHQHQRTRHTERRGEMEVTYIEATWDDYRHAFSLAQRVLGVSLDELSRWARELLEWLRRAGRGAEAREVFWTRRQLREKLLWPDRRVRESLDELVSMEYLSLERSSTGNLFLYALRDDPHGELPRVTGLLTPAQLHDLITLSKPRRNEESA